MIQLKLNWFGQGVSASYGDTADGVNDGKITFTYNNNTYSVPESVYKQIGSQWINTTDANRIENANAYTAYYISNGSFPANAEQFRTWASSNGFAISSDIDFNELRDKLGPALKNSIDTGTLQINNAPASQTVSSSGLTPATTDEQGRVQALNQYYQDVYSLAPGTGGAEMLSRLEQSYANQAQQAATMADVQFQQAAMQQAQTVKAITDQVRSERMARLRSGMSESQIANQDMQMLMTNVNTLNQNAQMLNQARLEAQTGMNLAQDQAYQDYLAQANQRGQVASAMAASDAGDAYQQTIRQMTTLYGNDPTKWTASQWSTISNQVTGQNQNK